MTTVDEKLDVLIAAVDALRLDAAEAQRGMDELLRIADRTKVAVHLARRGHVDGEENRRLRLRGVERADVDMLRVALVRLEDRVVKLEAERRG